MAQPAKRTEHRPNLKGRIREPKPPVLRTARRSPGLEDFRTFAPVKGGTHRFVGLTELQTVVLGVLSDRKQRGGQWLCRELWNIGWSPHPIYKASTRTHNTLGTLVKRGLVVRSGPGYRQGSLYQITKAGLKLYRKWESAY